MIKKITTALVLLFCASVTANAQPPIMHTDHYNVEALLFVVLAWLIGLIITLEIAYRWFKVPEIIRLLKKIAGEDK